jgi:hypothetical protein
VTPLALAFPIWLFGCYLALALTSLGTLPFWGAAAALGVAVLAASAFALRRGGAAAERLRTAALLATALLVPVLAVDTIYTASQNAQAAERALPPLDREPHLYPGEVNPRRYYPTERNFHLYKPGYGTRSWVYGESWNGDGPRLLASPTLAREALELTRVDYAVDAHGFRETTPIEEARVFALGDSFTFGVGVEDAQIWTTRLETLLGRPVYNLGITNHSPRQELFLLQHLFERQGERLRVEHLLWMICEGNDLEDSYAERRPGGAPSRLDTVLAGTPWGVLLGDLPESVRAASVLHRARTGALRLRRGASVVPPEAHEIDGQRLQAAVYRSERFGTRIFAYPYYIERAAQPREYVLEHPNRPLLDRTFEEMRELAARHRFRVTVILAPSAPRLYGAYFEGFPPLSERPHFLDYVGELGARMGFEVFDLLEPLRPYAERELLYRRDDTHWNPRGNQLVAERIAAGIFGWDGDMTGGRP